MGTSHENAMLQLLKFLVPTLEVDEGEGLAVRCGTGLWIVCKNEHEIRVDLDHPCVRV